MQLQFAKKTFRFLDIPVQEVKNTEVTQEIRLPDGMPDVGRVLTSWGQILLRNKQWMSGEIELNGGVKVWTLYAPEDGTEPRVVESWLPFQLRWDTGNTEKEGPVRMMPTLRNVDCRGISARKMMLRVGVGVLAQGAVPKEAEWFSPEDIPEEVQILKQTYPVRLPVGAGEKVFLVDEEIDSASAGISGSKIISCTVAPELLERKVLSDKLVFKGCTNLSLVLRDEEGRMESRSFEMPFSQLADLEGSYSPEAQPDIRFAVTDLEADLGDNGRIRVKCGLVAQYLLDDTILLELAEDAYCHCRNVDFKIAELMIPVVLEERTEPIKAEQVLPSLTVQVADCRFYPDFPRIRRGTDSVDIEIPGQLQTLFYGEDGMLQSTSTRWEGNLRIPSDADAQLLSIIQKPCQVQLVSGIDGLAAVSQLQMQLRFTAGRGMPMITEMELGETRNDDTQRPSVILRRCGNDSLWSIAKETGSTVSAICQANGITDQPVKDQMLLIPVS